MLVDVSDKGASCYPHNHYSYRVVLYDVAFCFRHRLMTALVTQKAISK